MAQIYGNGNSTPQSSIGTQVNTRYWDRKSLTDVSEEMFFSPLADHKSMPKHYGKELVVSHYIPLLDDRNVNDQGIDASGATIANGNLYGSSNDIGKFENNMPSLTEEGGRVNRVGVTRIERSGTLLEHGIFTEYTSDAMMFDTDDQRYAHLSRVMVEGANKIYEDTLQDDIRSASNTIIYTGAATSVATSTPEGASPSVVTFKQLKKLSRTFDKLKSPKNTKIIKGSRNVGTTTVNAARLMYVGYEMQSTLENLTDSFGNPAFKPVHEYADAATILNGEIGTVAEFRIIVVPTMQFYAGGGAAVGTNEGYSETNGNYDVFPMIVVGSESFATVGLQGGGTKGSMPKFQIITKKPGRETADRTDPFGKKGFMSIQWFYGFIALRPERIGVIYSCAAE